MKFVIEPYKYPKTHRKEQYILTRTTLENKSKREGHFLVELKE